MAAPRRVARTDRTPSLFAHQTSSSNAKAGAEPSAGSSRRRRRRNTTFQQWLPSFLLIVIVGVIAGSILALRTLGNAPADPAVQPEFVEPSNASAAGNVSSVAPSRMEQPSNRGSVRFTVQPIEPSYTVAAGDSLSSIAQRFNTTVDAVQSINNLPDRSTLSVGQRLVIP